MKNKKSKITNRYNQNLSLICTIFFSFFCFSSVVSCGFKPVYKMDSNKIFTYLQSIDILPINSINGVYYYDHLKRILPPTKELKYRLVSVIAYDQSHAIVQKNSDVSRKLVTVKINYSLVDIKTDKIITSGNFSRLSSFSTNFTAYSNELNKDGAYNQLAIMAAEEVRDRIILFIKDITK